MRVRWSITCYVMISPTVPPTPHVTPFYTTLTQHASPITPYVRESPKTGQASFRLGVTTPAVMSSVLVPTLLRGLSDRLQNVRLTAARVADDILSVAAMSEWPPPAGRDAATTAAARAAVASAATITSTATPSACENQANNSRNDDQDGSTMVWSVRGETTPSGAFDEAHHNGDMDGAVTAARRLENDIRVDAGGDGRRAGGCGWGCGWADVESRLEFLSREDSDRDVAYFAKQALKPKWATDQQR